MQILKAGVFYFALVFGAGFVLGPIRIRWAVPRFGTRMAERMETPIMFVVIVVAAREIIGQLFLEIPLPLSINDPDQIVVAMKIKSCVQLPHKAPPWVKIWLFAQAYHNGWWVQTVPFI